jgi:hypothetical protein
MTDEPIACTLTGPEQAVRRVEWDELRRSALVDVRVDGGVFTTTWRPEGRAQLAALVEAEKECCRFIDFGELEERDGAVVLQAGFPPGAEIVGELLFGVTPSAA